MCTGRGGPRKGAGRKPSRRPIVHHVRRDRFVGATPALVTVRVLDDVPSLRRVAFVELLKESFARDNERPGFRLVHYSVQRDHLHLMVEADDQKALGRGMKALCTRIVWAVKHGFGRSGRALAGRYHVRLLRTPRQVRNALRYVLLNSRKHWRKRTGETPEPRLDPCSSGRWFDGWKGGLRGSRDGPRDVAEARTWLLRVGWRRHGPIDPADVPGAA